MKKILPALMLIFCISQFSFSQDIIVRQDGTDIEAKIIEITSDAIRYKEFDFQDGPTRSISISEVSVIVYESGRTERFQPVTEEAPAVADRARYRGNYFMIGVGSGTSYGGVGIRMQFRVGGNVGFGMHGGTGYTFPDFTGSFRNDAYERISAGIKFFPFRNLYLNYQLNFHGDLYITGAGMIGVDQTFGRNVGLGFNAAAGFIFIDNRIGTNLPMRPALEMGFLIRF